MALLFHHPWHQPVLAMFVAAILALAAYFALIWLAIWLIGHAAISRADSQSKSYHH